jgi:hypothetical protein
MPPTETFSVRSPESAPDGDRLASLDIASLR